MSSQFSYELDERQIRILMQDAELDYSEALWNKFDQLATSQSKSSRNFSNYIPNINFSISRSIIVPVFFIVLIGGLSAMLFSFVDFKKKQSIKKEIPLIANSEKIKEPSSITKEVIKPKKIVPVLIKTSSIIVDTNIAIATKVPEIKKEEPVKIIEVKPKEIVIPTIVRHEENIVQPEKKKRRKRLIPSELPIINASTNLNDGADEPELELDLK